MTAPFVEGPLRQAVRHLFNADHEASQSAVAGYLRQYPCDPLAYAVSAAVRFYHYVSLRLPERQTKSIVGVLLGPGLGMPQAMQKEIGAALRRAQTLAAAPLASDPSDPNALLALSIAEGVNRDGLALVSKKWNASVAHAERAYTLARRLLERDPLAHDAYFVFGSTEYLVWRIPGPIRPFVRIPGVSGDKKKAIAFCQIAAKSGFYFQEFSRRTLVNLYVEEGKLVEAEHLLSELVVEFPGNHMLKADLQKLQGRSYHGL
jgi:hypothetical protein